MEAKHPKPLGKHLPREGITLLEGDLLQTGGAITIEPDSSRRDAVLATRTAKAAPPKKNIHLRIMSFRIQREKRAQAIEASSPTAKMLPIVEKKFSELVLATALAALEDEIVKTNESTEKLISISKGILENG